jgi:Fe-S cluster assembly protein SufD
MEASSILIGEGAESYNYGVFLAHKEENFHIGSSTIHKAPNTNSDILVKGIVKDKAKALYDGLVHIDRIAQNCNAYQHEDALILNEGAHADSIPTLTIDNKEVKCSHGSTISQVDKEKLFYLKTRGLNEASATRVIIEGFFEPIVQKMKGISQLKENILARIK